MRRRERSDDNPHGGICADQMGLGSRFTCLDYLTLLILTNSRNNYDACQYC